MLFFAKAITHWTEMGATVLVIINRLVPLELAMNKSPGT